MYPAGLCERWAGFFWQLPLLVCIIWLNFLPMTSLAPCYTTCGVRENPPSHTHIMQPPHSFYFFLFLPLNPPYFPPNLRARHLSLHHFHPYLSSSQIKSPYPVIFSLLSHFTPSLHPFFLPDMWKHLPPAACFLHECLCVQVWEHAMYYWASILSNHILHITGLLLNVLRTVVFGLWGVSEVFDGRNWPINKTLGAEKHRMPNKPAPKYCLTAEFCISIHCSSFELSWCWSSENLKSFELKGQVEL